MEGEFSNPERGVAGEENSKSKNGANAHICCVCFQPHTNYFLISCDSCNKWFHGNCVKITEKMAKAIREWFCPQCQEKDRELEIQHQHKKACRERDWETEAKARDHPAIPYGEIASDLFSESAGSGPMILSKDFTFPHKAPSPSAPGPLQRVLNQEKRSDRMCGECEACQRTEDCGHCDFCRDMKFGGLHKIRQKCRLRQCQRRVLKSYKHSPSSISPASVMQKLLALEEHFQMLKEEPEAVAPLEALSLVELPPDPEIYPDFPTGAFQDHSLPSLSDPEDVPFLEPVLWEPVMKVKHIKHRGKTSKKEEYMCHLQKWRRKNKRKHTEPTDIKDPVYLPQCLGPGCVQPAQLGSKYCSDDCGLKLAASRIYEILPQKIQEWQQSPCIAEEQEKKLLKKIRREQREAWLHVQDAERRFRELEDVILKAKQQVVQENEENIGRDGKHRNLQIFCVSCGRSVKSDVALRHMERCYAKYENQTPFGSMEPIGIEGVPRLFCQVYSPQSKTYCKRLEVLCPRHSRDPKAPADEVCGCPLVRNVFEPTGDFCLLSKRQCNQHYCWEKLHRAEVDLERVRAWYKLKKLFEQERNIQMAKANRAGLLALMLHQTIQHDPVTTDLRTKADH